MMKNEYGILDEILTPCLVLDSEGEILYYNYSLVSLFETKERYLKKHSNFFELFKFESKEIMVKFKKCLTENKSIMTGEEKFIGPLTQKERFITVKFVPRGQGRVLITIKDYTIE
ncbi:MAG: hypothetical protein HON90_07320, partial [Halobacteriovoraceae bacterium]|nr:hypothetical protein [Halobacteriovoraceae bacterium]